MVKKKPETHRLPCRNCDGQTIHEVLRQVKDTQSDENVDCWSYFEIVQCRGCEEISFRQNWQSTEDVDHDPTTGELVLEDHEELYPSRIAGRREIKDVYLLPPKVAAFYREAHQALCHRLRILAGIGIRGLVETVCQEKNAPGRNLEKRIDALVDLGVLTREGAEILHGTRLLGNDAAHEAKPLTEKQLDAAMDVAEHLLKGVFILPKKAESLPKRPSADGPPTVG